MLIWITVLGTFITEQQIIIKQWTEYIEIYMRYFSQVKQSLSPLITFLDIDIRVSNSNIKLSLQLTIHLLMQLSTMKDWIQVETELDMVILHAMLSKILHQEEETKLS